MFRLRVSVAEYHLDLGMHEQRREGYEVHTRLSGACGESMTQIIQPEMTHLRRLQRGLMRDVGSLHRLGRIGIERENIGAAVQSGPEHFPCPPGQRDRPPGRLALP